MGAGTGPSSSSSGPSVQHAHTTETHLASSGVDMGPSSKVLGKRKQVDETPVQVGVDPGSLPIQRKPGPTAAPSTTENNPASVVDSTNNRSVKQGSSNNPGKPSSWKTYSTIRNELNKALKHNPDNNTLR